jgi:hypothetical protein
MCLVRVCLPFLIYEMRLVSACLLSTCSHMIYKFSPTSPTRGGAHQLLNPRQYKCFKDVRQLVLHVMLLTLGPQIDHLHTYVRICVPMVMLHVGERRIMWRIIYRYSFFYI